MRKHILKIWDLPSHGSSAALIVMAVVFFFGGLAGCTLVNRVDGNGEAALSSYLEGYLSIAASGEVVRPEFITLIWKTIRWPLFAIVLGLTPIGLFGVPILFLMRAFLLSFSIASFFHVLGTHGLLFGFLVFGISGLLQIPVLFILGIQSFLNAGAITGRLIGEGRRNSFNVHSFLICCGVCAIILFLCCLLEYYTVPTLLGSFSTELLRRF